MEFLENFGGIGGDFLTNVDKYIIGQNSESSSTGDWDKLYTQNLYDQNLYDQNLYDQNLYDQNLYDQNLYNKSLDDQNLYDQNLFNPTSFDETTYPFEAAPGTQYANPYNENYPAIEYSYAPPAATVETVDLITPPPTPYQPTVFATYNTIECSPLGSWKLTASRTIYVRESTSNVRVLKSGRCVPPPVDLEDWNIWTVGNFEFKYTNGGLHLDYLREALKRCDKISRKKWNRKELEYGIAAERKKQELKGLIVDRPVNWTELGGWWVYVQPI